MNGSDEGKSEGRLQTAAGNGLREDDRNNAQKQVLSIF